jgi:DNA-binding MarR family transcriptional regulator
MIAFAAMEPERLAFLSELYTRSAGDAHQGVPYEALIDALGFDERVTKRIQRALEREGFVELTTVPPMTHLGRPVMDHASRHRRQQTISLTPHGQRLVEDLLAIRADTAPPTPSASASA